MNSRDTIRATIEGFRREATPTVEKLSQKGQKLMSACERVNRSWSGSFVGYHGLLYYKSFQIPPLGHLFSPEWGGINGIPEGWQKRSPEEVKAELERLVGSSFSIDRTEALKRELAERVNDFRADLLDQLSAVAAPRSERDSRLVSQIEQMKFGETRAEYVNRHLPKQLFTRDSNAMSQGMCIPSHLYYEGVAHEITTTSAAAQEFIKLLDRLTRYPDRVEDSPLTPTISAKPLNTLHPAILEKCQKLYTDGSYAEAVERGFKVVRDRLRQLTGHEKGADAFGKGKLHIKGAAAPNVDEEFNEGVKFLTMAIDRFRNEKSHTSDARIDDPVRAYEYLSLSSLALNLLENSEVLSA